MKFKNVKEVTRSHLLHICKVIEIKFALREHGFRARLCYLAAIILTHPCNISVKSMTQTA
jgi:hypothetical protein